MKRLLPALLVVAAAVLGLWSFGCYERAIGRRDATIQTRDKEIVALRARQAHQDTIYVHIRDTLRLVRRQVDAHLDTLWRTDTLTRIRIDTVRQLVEQERVACDAVVLSCEARVATRDTMIDSLRLQLTAERGKDRLPLFHVKLPSRTASLGFGVAAGLAAGLLLRR